MQQNFQSKLMNSGKTGMIYLVTAQASGKPAWYYLQVEASRDEAFKKHMESGKLDLAAYGKILYSGWGQLPPQAIEALVREQFEPA